MKRSDLAPIPGPNVSGFLYLAEFQDGLIKVGSSRAPRTRLEGIFDQRKRSGAAVYSRLVVADIGRSHSYAEELKLVHRLRRIGNVRTGREWFVDIRFGEALSMFKSAVRDVRDKKASRLLYCLPAGTVEKIKGKPRRKASAPVAAA
jgi:hypothetical protein